MVALQCTKNVLLSSFFLELCEVRNLLGSVLPTPKLVSSGRAGARERRSSPNSGSSSTKLKVSISVVRPKTLLGNKSTIARLVFS